MKPDWEQELREFMKQLGIDLNDEQFKHAVERFRSLRKEWGNGTDGD